MDALASAAEQQRGSPFVPATPEYVKRYLQILMAHLPNQERLWHRTTLPPNEGVPGLYRCMAKGQVSTAKSWLHDHGCTDKERALTRGNMGSLFDMLRIERTHLCAKAEDEEEPAAKRPRVPEPAPPERASAKRASAKLAANEAADESMEMEDRLGVLANDVELLGTEGGPDAALEAAVRSTREFEKSASDMSAASLASLRADEAYTAQAKKTIASWHALLESLRASLAELRSARDSAETRAGELESELKAEREKTAAGVVPALRHENEFLKTEKRHLEQELAGLKSENAQLEATNQRLAEDVNRSYAKCKALEEKLQKRDAAVQEAAQALKRVYFPLTPTVSEVPAD